VIVLTVDNLDGRNNETLARGMREDKRACTTCHVNNEHNVVKKAPMFAGLDISHVNELSPSNITWDFLKRLRDYVSVKLLVKGIVTGEDAALCVTHGADGVIVSNHGGRNEEHCVRRSSAFPKWWLASPVACRCSWMVESDAAPMYSRLWRSAREPWESAGPRFGGWRPLVSKGLRRSSTF
jgi:isopentenyl diphosphate isomerase/L-lactate dehydrogenase-like FMN-dependent dehydrogenase